MRVVAPCRFQSASPGSDRSDATAASRLKLEGGAGFDKLSADFGNETEAIVFTGGVGNSHDFADGSYFRNFEALVNFTSGSGNDTFALPGRLDHFLNARAGNDIVNPGLGIDTVNGGDGSDLLILDYSAGDDANVGGVVLSGSTMLRRDVNTNAIIDSISFSGFERAQFTGGSKADALTGFAGDNFLDGGAGNDFLIGGAGNDTLIAHIGSDTISGGTGDDIITASEFTSGLGYSVDVFDAGDGDDVVADAYSYGDGTFAPATATTRLKLDGGAGFDRLSAVFGNQTQAITFISGQTNSFGFADGSYFRNFEALGNFASGSGNDTLTLAGRENQNLNAGAGDDTVNPGLGIDNVQGGDGIDLIIVDFSVGDGANVSGVMNEGAFVRRRDLNTGAILDSLFSQGFERVDATGGSKGDQLAGGNLADIFHGNAGDDVINGNGGDDLVHVGRGNDTADGGSGSDL